MAIGGDLTSTLEHFLHGHADAGDAILIYPPSDHATVREDLVVEAGPNVQTDLVDALARLADGAPRDEANGSLPDGVSFAMGTRSRGPSHTVTLTAVRPGGEQVVIFGDGGFHTVERAAAAPAGPIGEPEVSTSSAAWIPTSSGDLTERDIAESFKLADHLGRWVELLSDDDLRLPAAEATRDQLSSELRLPEPRRAMLRACVQAALDLLRSDLDTFTRELGNVLRVDLDSRPSLVPDPPTVTGDEALLEEQWAEASETITALATAAASDDPTSATSDGATPGRGTVLTTFVRRNAARLKTFRAYWSGLSGVIWLSAHAGPLVHFAESLLNLVGL